MFSFFNNSEKERSPLGRTISSRSLIGGRDAMRSVFRTLGSAGWLRRARELGAGRVLAGFDAAMR
jgi:hypothetical protein